MKKPLLILLLALVLRLGMTAVVWHHNPQGIVSPDTSSYEKPALYMAQGGSLRGNPHLGYHTPGYPLFIAAAYKVFGPSRLALIIVQGIFGVATVGLLYMLTRKWFGEAAALLACLILALDPVSITAGQRVLSETWFTFALMLALLSAARAVMGGRLWWYALAGALIAAGAWIRPIALYLIFPVLGLALAAEWKRSAWLRMAGAAELALLAWLALVMPWQARNANMHGGWSFSYLKNDNLLHWTIGNALTLKHGITLDEARTRIDRTMPDMREWTLGGRDEVYRKKFTEMARENWPWLVKVHIKGIYMQLKPANYDLCGLTGMPRMTMMVIEMTFMLILALCVLAGISVCFRRFDLWPLHLLLIGTAIYLAVLAAGTLNGYRFRVPYMPIVALYGGIGIATIIGKGKDR